MKKRFIIALASSLVCSCENLNDPGLLNQSSVVCLLVANESPQRFYVYRTASLNENAVGDSKSKFQAFFIDNASIKVNDVVKTYNFKIQLDTVNSAMVRSYTPESLLVVQPSAAYSLLVNSGLGSIQGQTLVPGDFSIVKPINGELLSRIKGKLRPEFSWTRCKYAELYTVKLTQFYSTGAFKYPMTHSFDVLDTTLVLPYELDVYSPDTLYAEIYAFEKNYYRHRFKSVASSGITGGYGYFGSAVLKKVTVFVY